MASPAAAPSTAKSTSKTALDSTALDTNGEVNAFLNQVAARNPGEPEFLQAVHEVAIDIVPFTADHPEYREARILERMAEPDRIISFRVCWTDDNNKVQINRAYRVQNNNAIGP